MKRLAIAALVVASLALTGCTSHDSAAEDVANGTTQNYQSKDGNVETMAADKRGAPISFTSATETGDAIRSKDYLGKVLVLNFWYASCSPCRAEAPILETAYTTATAASEDVAFLGVNTRDQIASVFEKQHGLTYPSAIDTNDGNILLAFAGKVPANAVPTTIILDRKGRVAARVLGQIKSSKTLEDMIDSVLAEDS